VYIIIFSYLRRTGNSAHYWATVLIFVLSYIHCSFSWSF